MTSTPPSKKSNPSKSTTETVSVPSPPRGKLWLLNAIHEGFIADGSQILINGKPEAHIVHKKTSSSSFSVAPGFPSEKAYIEYHSDRVNSINDLLRRHFEIGAPGAAYRQKIEFTSPSSSNQAKYTYNEVNDHIVKRSKEISLSNMLKKQHEQQQQQNYHQKEMNIPPMQSLDSNIEESPSNGKNQDQQLFQDEERENLYYEIAEYQAMVTRSVTTHRQVVETLNEVANNLENETNGIDDEINHLTLKIDRLKNEKKRKKERAEQIRSQISSIDDVVSGMQMLSFTENDETSEEQK